MAKVPPKKLEIKVRKYMFESEFGWTLVEEVPPLLGRRDILIIFI